MVPLIWASGYTAGVHGLAQSEVKARGRKILQNRQLVTTLNQWIKKNLRPREARTLDCCPLGRSELGKIYKALVDALILTAPGVPDGPPSSAGTL